MREWRSPAHDFGVTGNDVSCYPYLVRRRRIYKKFFICSKVHLLPRSCLHFFSGKLVTKFRLILVWWKDWRTGVQEATKQQATIASPITSGPEVHQLSSRDRTRMPFVKITCYMLWHLYVIDHKVFTAQWRFFVLFFFW